MSKSNLSKSDDAVFNRIYPLMFEIEKELGEFISLKLWASLSRLLITRGLDLEDLKVMLVEQCTDQAEFNKSRKH